ncbi:NF-kappa-B inhibitor zeta-like [Solea senegalensis]|uniref:NF-kappa-B inhibitor zeta-like n=2 Tax=Solea TaxID=28828 RepID=A0AAV6RG03_SOLSE|nr:NF-kappa-B inhibitor zeta-like [Solea senegalensis]KAG7503359.1 NF-kappa-B inhibitor zeta-like [Solea senegalensis]
MINYNGLTPLHVAVLSHNAVVKQLSCLENPHSSTAEGLMQRKWMFVECIKTLFLMGASLTTRDLKSGRTCFHMASEEANMELLQVILNQPLSLPIVNFKTFSGNTALHIVCSLHSNRSQVEAVKLLMRNGADPGSRNFENDLPAQLVPEGVTGKKVRQILKGNMLKLK